ncbi:glycoside hydrolase [uncultured Clostridium sp.]|uniref:glycoside hydrolase n=1 Tax=uncultured Clostridium sp. TaxID=59620 RepID=UPI0025FD46E4|nr:glycoside hydrolase [uncultured Clostridium sp.]
MKNNGFSAERKDKVKILRSIGEGIILISLLIIILKSLLSFSVYEPYEAEEFSNTGDTGFIAVSYFGVDRNGDDTLISTDRLNEHLKALKDNGYVTITQQDILDYYENGKKLPEKSLFLIFEDGRTDTAIFSQNITEEYNYKSTMLTYADKFEKEDPKFLKPNDIKYLEKSTFWEVGTNGYRLEYINVFDKNHNFLGRMNSVEFSKEAPDIRRDYNHYLMDYIRDEDNVPIESYDEMKERIDYDYKTSAKIYEERLGKNPDLYILMHSNTGQFGTNNKASRINEKWIKELYKMNFNREGYSFNTKESSIYDLTRIQPQSYWPVNHLLMRIAYDTGSQNETKFVTGDESKAAFYKEVCGKAEYEDNLITLTSLPQGKGMLKLLNSDNFKDFKLNVELKGNVLGSQSVCLRTNEDGSSSVNLQLVNNVINIVQKVDGSEENLFTKKLDSNKDEFDIRDEGDRNIKLEIKDDIINLYVDYELVAEDVKMSDSLNKAGAVYLESSWDEYGYSQRNIADDVYDGVFKNIKITDMDDNELFSNELKNIEKVKYLIKNVSSSIINWFIKNL